MDRATGTTPTIAELNERVTTGPRLVQIRMHVATAGFPGHHLKQRGQEGHGERRIGRHTANIERRHQAVFPR